MLRWSKSLYSFHQLEQSSASQSQINLTLRALYFVWTSFTQREKQESTPVSPHPSSLRWHFLFVFMNISVIFVFCHALWLILGPLLYCCLSCTLGFSDGYWSLLSTFFVSAWSASFTHVLGVVGWYLDLLLDSWLLESATVTPWKVVPSWLSLLGSRHLSQSKQVYWLSSSFICTIGCTHFSLH